MDRSPKRVWVKTRHIRTSKYSTCWQNVFLYTVQGGGGAVLLKYAISLFSNSAYNQKLIIAKSVSVIITMMIIMTRTLKPENLLTDSLGLLRHLD